MIENKYLESVEESGNYLRMTLQSISKYKLPYNPISYFLWYEYATGRNEQLCYDIEMLLEKKEPITFNIIIHLFKKHIADNQILVAEKKAGEFQRILVELSKHLSKSGNEIDSQGNILDAYIIEMSQATSLDSITGIAKRIVLETKSMIESSKILKNKLNETVSEINILSEEIEGVKKTAKTDILTNLLNRRGFDEAMTEVLEKIRITHEPLSVIMLDIDHFKKINDTFGHLIGDTVLKMLSNLLKNHVKGKDIVARFGGDEVILLLPETSLDGAYILAEQIRLRLMEMNWKSKNTGKSIGSITISLGIALYKDGESIEAFIKRADDALYHAKNTGRNRTVTELNLGKG